MRPIDADKLDCIKFHPLPYTHITPTDADAESYKRGWNDAIDVIMSESPTIEPKVGKWLRIGYDIYECSECHQYVKTSDIDAYDWCHHCGAKMEVERKCNRK